ncbi:MAG: alpha-N-arabinofuranosidase [Spirochaetota bacterium]
MLSASVTIDSAAIRADIDERVFGSFIEHLGRAVYGGIYEPDHPTADENGFRGDVLELVRDLRVPIVRYPGGNYVSAFNWEDGIGPIDERPRRLDLAWRSVEPNWVGIHEFARWAERANTSVMMALNLGTRGIEEARNLVEYCNHPGDSYWSDLRRKNGATDPFGFKVWCLGNEMDGPWQVGQKTADEYGRLSSEVGKALKLFDPSLELVACGSSSSNMPTYPQWEATVLEHCYETVDFLSLHQYYDNHRDDLDTFLGESVAMEAFIRTVASTADFVKAKKRSRKTMMLSFDEWNVWFHSRDADTRQKPWTVGPPLLEDVYTFEDALVVGLCLITLIRNADRVRMACLAQLVNTIAPIMTQNGGPAWRQTIYYPFMHASLYGRGTVMETFVDSPAYENEKHGHVPYVDAVMTVDREHGTATLFAVNRNKSEDAKIDGRMGGFPLSEVQEHLVLTHPDIKAANTKDQPDRVVPGTATSTTVDAERFATVLAPLSWNVVRFKLA